MGVGKTTVGRHLADLLNYEFYDSDREIEKITGAMEIAGYGVFGTPAVVVDGEVKSVGKIPKKEDVKSWLAG